jgi:hypothetical protein
MPQYAFHIDHDQYMVETTNKTIPENFYRPYSGEIFADLGDIISEL